MKNIPLSKLQSQMQHNIYEPSSSTEVLTYIVSDFKKKSQDRIEIYTNAYYARVVESMSSDFKITKQILGEQLFQNMVVLYLGEYRSRSYNLNEVGQYFLNFVSTLELIDQMPFLKDIILLEWNLQKAIWSPVDWSITPAGLRIFVELAQKQSFDQILIKLNPSLIRMSSCFDLASICQSEEASKILEILSDPREDSRDYLIFRNLNGVQVFSLSDLHGCVLDLLVLQNGEALLSLAEVFEKLEIELFQNQKGPVDVTAVELWQRQVFGVIQDFISQQILSEFIFKIKEENPS